MPIKMDRGPKRRLRFRVLLFVLLFAVALIIWFALSIREQRRQQSGERTYLAEPVLPVIWPETLTRIRQSCDTAGGQEAAAFRGERECDDYGDTL